MFKKQEPKFVDSKSIQEEHEVKELKDKIDRLKNHENTVENTIPEPIQEDNQEKVEVENEEESGSSQVKAIIVSSELLESGKFRTIIISDEPLGVVGNSFDL